jgi:hypothetical protein
MSMRDWLSGRTTIGRALLILVGLMLTSSALGESSNAKPRIASATTVQVHAGERVDLRHLLNVATGSAPERGNRGQYAVSAVVDEIYWDGFELCGDGVIDAASEQCDRSDLGGASCLNAGFTTGSVSCDATCHLDTTQCSGACPTSCAIDNDCGVCGPCLQLGGGAGICTH